MEHFVVSGASEIGGDIKEFAERVRCLAVRAYPTWGRADVELYAVEFFLKRLGNKGLPRRFWTKPHT